MIKFYEKRKIFFTISICLILIGVIAIFVNGVELSIQFSGGSIIKYAFEGDIDTSKVQDIVSDTLKRNVDTQITEDNLTKSKKLVLNLSGNYGLDSSEQKKLDDALKSSFEVNKLELSESNIVEPFIGRSFLNKGITAVLLSAVAIIIYVWIRFKRIGGLTAGVISIIALIHDVMIVFFTFVIFRIPLNDSFIAVMLTIIGYSINDTIIIYDRIRENKKLFPKMAFDELVNLSITESITRSINTSITTIMSIVILFVFSTIFDIESIKYFSLPLIFGLLSGCYSSVCIAGPIWVMIKNRRSERNKINERI